MMTDVDTAGELRFASFDAAWKRALRLARDCECDFIVTNTGDAQLRYAVEEDGGQGGAIAFVSADPAEALCLSFHGRERIPLPPVVLPAANDR